MHTVLVQKNILYSGRGIATLLQIGGGIQQSRYRTVLMHRLTSGKTAPSFTNIMGYHKRVEKRQPYIAQKKKFFIANYSKEAMKSARQTH